MKDRPITENEHSESKFELPEEEEDLDNLTEYNTARNVKMVKMPVEPKLTVLNKSMAKKRKVTFNNEEDVINPEDVDSSIGKFRNSCSVTIIPTKVKNITKLQFFFCGERYKDNLSNIVLP